MNTFVLVAGLLVAFGLPVVGIAAVWFVHSVYGRARRPVGRTPSRRGPENRP